MMINGAKSDKTYYTRDNNTFSEVPLQVNHDVMSWHCHSGTAEIQASTTRKITDGLVNSSIDPYFENSSY